MPGQQATRSALPLAVCLFFNGKFSYLFFIIELVLMIYKGVRYEYPEQVSGVEQRAAHPEGLVIGFGSVRLVAPDAPFVERCMRCLFLRTPAVSLLDVQQRHNDSNNTATTSNNAKCHAGVRVGDSIHPPVPAH